MKIALLLAFVTIGLVSTLSAEVPLPPPTHAALIVSAEVPLPPPTHVAR